MPLSLLLQDKVGKRAKGFVGWLVQGGNGSLSMKRITAAITATIALCVIATPILAQQGERVSRECRKEIVQLCGRDRSQMRACLIEQRDRLSQGCKTELQKRLRENGGERSSARVQRTGEEVAYGSAPLQNADFWHGTGNRAPLVLFVHGGGWKRGDKAMMQGSAKLSHWQAQGYAVASVNYRLVPDATVEDQAADVAASIAWFRTNAAQLGIDPDRIVIVGHSAGAHLVSLVGTDPAYFAAEGMRPDDIRGVIALDGAAYWVADQMGENARLMGDTYTQAFGTDPARQDRLSPTLHAAAPNAPAFLILHVDRKDAARQSKALGEALRSAGSDAQVKRVAGRGLPGHMEINRKLGEPDYPATAIVDDWLKAVLG